MARRLPPLNALRAFEAAARHMSFTRAADELNVTQAAISHQIKALEETLGVALFRRLNRALQLTAAGQAYLPPLRDAFDQMAEATARLKASENTGQLTVSTLASFAGKWLVPRLPRFQHRNPGIDVLISTTSQLVDFTHQEVDLAIRFGRGGWAGLRCERLLTEEIFPVCTPALAEGMRTPQDLVKATLLHDDFRIGWEIWLAAAGVSGVDHRRGTRFTDSSLVLHAALAGQGIGLGRHVLVADDLASGRLVRLFDITLPSEIAYWVVAPERHFERPKVKAFRDWLHEEAQAHLDAGHGWAAAS
ncbi:transcriptional regulator GcvA [Arenibaculum sp.]|uniref:transcriptional regulator GcvA n=1 Tax=Arenibaculum sp. TaxID=2865862 RepID=UPI002E0FF04D|nr:transcriptional regulator GcvA [Arenibaculum sp.]